MRFKKFAVISIVLLFLMSIIAGCGGTADVQDTTDGQNQASEFQGEFLMVFCGAGLREPMDEIGEVFEEKFGVKIEYTYAGSAQNLSQIELSGQGDVYVPGSLYYYEAANEKGLIEDKKDVAYHIPVIAVPKGNPANIQSLEDLGNPGVKVVLGDEKSAAIGKVCVKMFEENGLTEAVAKNTIAKAATVNELVVYVTMQQADASIIWEDNVMGVEEIEMIQIPEKQNQIKTIPVCVLKHSTKKELAQMFVDFVASEEGKQIYKKHGFKPVE